MLYLLLLACTGTPDSTTPIKTETMACGTLACKATEVCLEESYPPECENRTDTGVDCPEGTTASMCGGAGFPCCCGPAPEMTYACVDASACGNTCDCIECPTGKACIPVGSESSGVFLCEELPMP